MNTSNLNTSFVLYVMSFNFGRRGIPFLLFSSSFRNGIEINHIGKFRMLDFRTQDRSHYLGLTNGRPNACLVRRDYLGASIRNVRPTLGANFECPFARGLIPIFVRFRFRTQLIIKNATRARMSFRSFP